MRKQGRLTPWTLLKYTVATLFVNVLFYLLGGALSVFSEAIAIITAILLIGAVVKTSQPKPGDIIIYGAGTLGSDIMASPIAGHSNRYQSRDGHVYEKDSNGNVRRIS